MARSNTKSINREKTLTTFTIDMSESEDQLVAQSKKIATLLEVHKNKTINPGDLAYELKRLYQDGLLYLTGASTKNRWEDCKCIHPKKITGYCLYGMCIAPFKYGINVTIKI